MNEKSLYSSYREDPLNLPPLGEGKYLSGGPWLRCGEAEGWQHKYCRENNGLLAVICADPDDSQKAHVYVAPATGLNCALVRDNGFSDQSFQVPLSNWDYDPKNPYHQQFKEDRARFREMGGKILPGAHRLTGVAYKLPSLRLSDEGTPAMPLRIEPVLQGSHLGTYNERCGMVACVDPEGDMFLMLPGNIGVLEKLGYKRDETLPVPFCADEEVAPQHRSLAQFLEEVRSKPIYQGNKTDRRGEIDAAFRDLESIEKIDRQWEEQFPEGSLAREERIAQLHERAMTEQPTYRKRIKAERQSAKPEFGRNS